MDIKEGILTICTAIYTSFRTAILSNIISCALNRKCHSFRLVYTFLSYTGVLTKADIKGHHCYVKVTS